jgi:XTP/dITP diphosphohydrolase
MRGLVLATANRGKAAELRVLLRDVLLEAELAGVELRTLADYPGLPEVEERGGSFAENALLKARAAWRGTGIVALADDSGLEIDALDGAPGVYSARFAGMERDDEANMGKVLSLLGDMPPERRTARFQCALALVGLPENRGPEGRAGCGGGPGLDQRGCGGCPELGAGEYVAIGSLEGVIVSEKRGVFGFGYDPIFCVPERGLTLAQMLPQEKNVISHRARAFARMLPVLGAYLRG